MWGRWQCEKESETERNREENIGECECMVYSMSCAKPTSSCIILDFADVLTEISEVRQAMRVTLVQAILDTGIFSVEMVFFHRISGKAFWKTHI